MTARHHHYLPQCYLKGFTKKGDKRSKLLVFDFEQNNSFSTIPRNVGGIRDFNRVESESLDPDSLENALSVFENDLAHALKDLGKREIFKDDIRIYILNLVALIAVRSPEMRKRMESFQSKIFDQILHSSLANEERWETIRRQMKNKGIEEVNDITYDEVKTFLESKKYSLEIPRENHILTEFDVIDTVIPLLLERKWQLIKANDNSGPFISSDKPLSLTWKEPDKIPPFYRNSPGFGMKETTVYFPISKNYAIIGEFEGIDIVVDATIEIVSTLNTIILLSANKYVYTPGMKFYINDAVDNKPVDGIQELEKLFSNSAK